MSLTLSTCEIYKEAVFESVRQVQNLSPTYKKGIHCRGVQPSGGNRAELREFPNIAALGYQKNKEPI